MTAMKTRKTAGMKTRKSRLVKVEPHEPLVIKTPRLKPTVRPS